MATQVKGAINLRKALNKFTPDLAKETRKEIANFLKPIVKQARGYAPSQSPLSGWAPRPTGNAKFPTYDAQIVKRGISYQTTASKPNRKGFRSLAAIYNKFAAGAIYETAGRKNPGGNFSPRLSGELKGTGKDQGRLIFRAWEEDKGKANAAVLKAIFNAAEKFKARKK